MDESDLNVPPVSRPAEPPQAAADPSVPVAPAAPQPAYAPNPYLVASQAPPAQQQHDAAIAANPYLAVPHMTPPAAPDAQFRLRLVKVTSMLVLTQRRTSTFTGTFDQLAKAYKKARLHNLLLGWWGIPWGLVRTPMALSSNSRAFKKLKQLAGR